LNLKTFFGAKLNRKTCFGAKWNLKTIFWRETFFRPLPLLAEATQPSRAATAAEAWTLSRSRTPTPFPDFVTFDSEINGNKKDKITLFVFPIKLK
jgi:hypothetical protein